MSMINSCGNRRGFTAWHDDRTDSQRGAPG
jgi:hypothetical protein